MKKVQHIFPALFASLFLLFALQGHCQSKDGDHGGVYPDEQAAPAAPAAHIPSDSAMGVSPDSLLLEKSDLSTSIIYTAEDSMVMDVPNRKVMLYGKASVVYGDISLTAARISVDWTKNEMRAYGVVDSTGNYKGKPFFRQGDDQYVCDSMGYGINSGKGIIYNIVTEQNGGYVQGSPVKRTNDAVYIEKGSYTTCNMGHPHFKIQAHKLKIIPEKEIISGPFHMVISDIPTPIGFPLGFFPIIDKGKSGIIFPTVGENRSRGFFISQGGYYIKVKEKMGISLIGDFYSNGSMMLGLTDVYKSRYNYNGNFAINASRTREGFGSTSTNPFLYTYQVKWSHRTDPSKGYIFSSDVNMISPQFYSKNSYDPNRIQTNAFNSVVSYYKSIRNTPFNFTISGTQTQNVQTKVMTVSVPTVSMNMNRVYPFRKKVGSGKDWYEQIVFQVTGNAGYTFSNKIHDYKTYKDSVYKFTDSTYTKILSNGTPSARWDIPVSATFNVAKYFNLTPTLNYTEFWYLKRLNYSYNYATDTVEGEFQNGFYRAYQYNAQMRMNTWIYGKWTNHGGGALRGILHSINPVVAYTFKPDFSTSENNYQKFALDTNLRGDPNLHNRYAAAPYSPSGGLQNSISFEIRNIVEAKYKSRKDTVNLNGKKIKLLENLSVSSAYDFTKDSLKMSNYLFNARTRIALFDINFNSTFDPYIYIHDDRNPTNKAGIKVNRYAFAEGQGLAKLTSLTFNVSRTFGPKKLKGAATATQRAGTINTPEAQHIYKNPNEYVDFNMPWGLTIAYMYGYAKNGLADAVINRSISFNGNVSLSPKWKITFQTGYDFILKGPGATSLSLTRDLHCWQASFNCVPFGPRQSYFFTFNAKSTLLQDLKLSKKSPGFFGQY